MTPKFLAYKTEWVVDDSTFFYDKDITSNTERVAGFLGDGGGVDN